MKQIKLIFIIIELQAAFNQFTSIFRHQRVGMDQNEVKTPDVIAIVNYSLRQLIKLNILMSKQISSLNYSRFNLLQRLAILMSHFDVRLRENVSPFSISAMVHQIVVMDTTKVNSSFSRYSGNLINSIYFVSFVQICDFVLQVSCENLGKIDMLAENS